MTTPLVTARKPDGTCPPRLVNGRDHCLAYLGHGLGGWQGGFFYDLTGAYTWTYANAAVAGIAKLLIVSALWLTLRRRRALAFASAWGRWMIASHNGLPSSRVYPSGRGLNAPARSCAAYTDDSQRQPPTRKRRRVEGWRAPALVGDRRRRLGIKDAPPPLPHPDDPKIDMRTGSVQIAGPMTKEEIPLWNGLRELKRENKRDIFELERALEEEPDGPQRKTLLDDLEEQKTIRDFIDTILPDDLPDLLHVGRKIG